METEFLASDKTIKERKFIPSFAQVGSALYWPFFFSFFFLLYPGFRRNESKLAGGNTLILMLTKTLSIFPSKKH